MGEITVRTASADEVLALVTPLLPDTVQLVADLQGTGVATTTRAFLAERDGRAMGAVVVSRRCRGRWYASPGLIDTDAARPLATVINRSPAWEVGGASSHVEPLIPHLSRRARRPPIREHFYTVHVPDGVLELDPRCRLAGPDDLEAMVELYADYEFGRIPTRPRLRAFLGRLLATNPAIVAEVDGTLGAACLCLYRTPSHDMWGDTTVLPAFRRQGLATVVGLGGAVVTAGSGRVMCGVQAGANPMEIERMPTSESWLDHMRADQWTQQALQSPRRFPGHRRVRRAFERLEGSLERRPGLVRDERAEAEPPSPELP